ncbi:MAG TPA: VanZ family protein [Clostridia bacterium]|nr:VanZ family protein [Clostridia bacterium]
MLKPVWKKGSKLFTAQLIAAAILLLFGLGGTVFALRVFYHNGSFLGPVTLLLAALVSPVPIAFGVWLLYALSGSTDFRKKLLGMAWWFFTVLYCAILGFVLFGGGRRDYDYSYLRPNFVPFVSIVREIGNAFIGRFHMSPLIGIVGNLLLFSPLGFLLPWKMKGKRPKSKAALLLFAAILSVEVFQQLFVKGVFDIDDILLNFTGALLGIAVQAAVQKSIPVPLAANLKHS